MGNQKYGVKNSFKRIFRYDLTNKTFEPVSDSIKGNNIINTPIIFDEANKKIFAFERIILKFIKFPFGLSIIVIAKK
jgi:hypothetical protein